jgi:transposase
MPQAYLGIDISKAKFHVALQLEEKRHNQAKIKVFPNNLSGFEQGHTVSIVNPARIKGFAVSELSRSKTDKADAQLIVRFLMALRPEQWLPPAPETKQLQLLLRRVEALQQMIVQERNR